MSEHPHEDSECHAQKRFQPFLDCVAYLIAKRWLREQQQEDDKHPREGKEPCDEELE